ncbi:hypothetical protein QMK19_03220 [Streptomyces sp. H10-C2]|uniref:hypothetical protein n=1 Tax=unclassified Streptomyces TaxID=2593676 RepID=UPI0024BB37B9|nr:MULTISPECIES: hypothetical protein [unclassified Streptomyces]MDJ0342196.1 hypothetical protein [Streptomyces sp. PH10-H1]MDJ0368710.1 hypothetical protein [Streptomyces sp. H10-C2]
MSRISRRDLGDGARGFGLGALILIATVLVVALVGALIWAIGVFSSDTAGTGNVHKDQQSAQNREHWSATYNGDYAQVKADQDNLTTLKSAAEGQDATQQDRTNYLGAQLNCRTDVATYNADAANVLGHQWIPDGLPSTLNAATYCGSN